MTFAYSAYFAFVWSAAILAIPGAFVLLGFSISWSIPHAHNATAIDELEDHPVQWAAGYASFALLTVFAIVMRTHGPRVLVRAGAWPVICGDAFPTTETDLVAAVKKMYAANGRPPSVVGSAWGLFIKRSGLRGPRIFLHNYRGRVPGTERWRSGTTIAAVAKHLLKDDQTFPSHPTMDYISLGAWFCQGNHGNGGDLNTGSSKCLQSARVLDMPTGEIETIDYAELRRRFDGVGDHEPTDYCVLDVAFKGLISNADVQKKGIIVDSPETAAEWLAPGAYLRVCFQGAARDYGIGLRWEEIYRPASHRDPHCCSRICMYAQVDLCSICCGLHESMLKFSGITNRLNANRWMPIILPLESVVAVLGGYRNYELIFKLPQALDGNTLFKLISSMRELHKEIGGRSEVRYGTPSADTPVFLDCVFRGSFDRVFALLRREFGVESCALHPGKWTAPPTAPLRRVTLASMYGMTSGGNKLV